MSPNQMCIGVAEGLKGISFTTVFYTMQLFWMSKTIFCAYFLTMNNFHWHLKATKIMVIGVTGSYLYRNPTKSHWWQYCQNHRKMWTLVSHELEYNQLLLFLQSPISLSILSPLVSLSLHHSCFPLYFLLLYLPLWPTQRADQTDHYCRSFPKIHMYMKFEHSLKDYFWKKNLIDGDIVNKLRVTTEFFDQTWVSRRQTPHTNCAVPENQRCETKHHVKMPQLGRESHHKMECTHVLVDISCSPAAADEGSFLQTNTSHCILVPNQPWLNCSHCINF